MIHHRRNRSLPNSNRRIRLSPSETHRILQISDHKSQKSVWVHVRIPIPVPISAVSVSVPVQGLVSVAWYLISSTFCNTLKEEKKSQFTFTQTLKRTHHSFLLFISKKRSFLSIFVWAALLLFMTRPVPGSNKPYIVFFLITSHIF
jgi:hypothetical protein